METKVLTQEELTQLRDLQNQQNAVLMNLGSIEYRMSLLEQTKIELKSQVLEIEKMNNELGAKLTEKYGNGNLNLETGETDYCEVNENQAVYIPNNMAHGFLTLEPNTIVVYMVEGDYNPESEHSLRWFENPTVSNVVFEHSGVNKITISEKDKLGK